MSPKFSLFFIALFVLMSISAELKCQNLPDEIHAYFTITDTISIFDAATYTETFTVITDTIYETALPIYGDCLDLEENKRAGCSESQLEFPLMIGVQQFYEALSDETKEGIVKVKFYIDNSGTPNILEVSSALDVHFEKKAIELISDRTRWMPGKISGEKVNVAVIIPIVFQRIIKEK